VLEFILEQIREVRVMMESGEGKARDVQGVQRLDQRFRNERTDSAEHPRRVPAEILGVAQIRGGK
jgi:hypothetical protein